MENLDILLEKFVQRSKYILKDDLVGIYLHGSAVMGCFNPDKSDVDLIIVIKKPITDEVKRKFMENVLEVHRKGPAKGIEMSVVTADVCKPFVYPTPYELHFSIGHIDRYEEDPDGYIREMNGTDKDLAAHFTVITNRGVCLYGPPIEEVFAKVPEECYMDSIRFDIENAEEEIEEYPLYLTLNLCRVLAYKEERLVCSKKEGGEWALENIPEEYSPLVKNALLEYAEGAEVKYDADLLKKYAAYMLKRIGTPDKKLEKAFRHGYKA